VDDGLRVHLERSGDVPVVRVVGEIDLATAPHLRDRLTELPHDSGTVIVDLSEVTFLDSTGLSVLVASWKRLSNGEDKGDLRLVVNRPAIERILEVTGLAQVFGVFSTLELAIQG
jgi:anti-sigma B factor antagonist